MKDIKEFIAEIYSSLLDESINSWLKSEDVMIRMKESPEDKVLLKEKIKKVSDKISKDFADEIIKEGFPDKDQSTQKVKKILNQIIEKHAGELRK